MGFHKSKKLKEKTYIYIYQRGVAPFLKSSDPHLGGRKNSPNQWSLARPTVPCLRKKHSGWNEAAGKQ